MFILSLALNVTDQLHVSAALPPSKRSRFELLGEEKKFASTESLTQILQTSWSNSWCVCVWGGGTVVFVHSLDFMTFLSASVMFLWTGFSHVYKEPHLHPLVTTAPKVKSYNRHNTVNMGTLALPTDVANFYYSD